LGIAGERIGGRPWEFLGIRPCAGPGAAQGRGKGGAALGDIVMFRSDFGWAGDFADARIIKEARPLTRLRPESDGYG